jgi:F0F1-type ATP synthase membrane subunit b/b'
MIQSNPPRLWSLATHWLKFGSLLLAMLMLHIQAQAQDVPAITPSLKQALSGLPIAGIKDEVKGMVGALKKTSCGGNLTGCYMTQSGPLQLYFFTSGQSQQTLLLVVDKKMAMPRLLSEKVQKVMGETSLSSPIISLSTTDFELDQIKMPPPLKKVVQDNYFNINTLSFSSGVQVAARATLGGAIKLTMESMGVTSNQMMMRAAVVMPIPTDVMGGASAGAGVADAMAHGATMQEAGKDAAEIEAFVEFQFAPNAVIPLKLPKGSLRDGTFFINNALTFGYKGNLEFTGVEGKNVLMHFQTPLSPAGVMDLLDFSFRMATPPKFTLEDAARMMVAMASPDPRLAKYGGGFIRDIETFKDPLLMMAKPLSTVQLHNPTPAPEYRFGDSSKPFPDDNKYFNFVLLGPTADGGPLLQGVGDVTILGQKMGWMMAAADEHGLNSEMGEQVTLKLGPLGKVKFRMQATTVVRPEWQQITMIGNFAGQEIRVSLRGIPRLISVSGGAPALNTNENSLEIEMNASCVNPFEIKAKMALTANLDLAEVFERQGGVNVDPSKISGCIGAELEAAYKKIAGEYKNLSGYTASAANAELKKIADVGGQAEKEAQRVAAEAEKKAAREAEKKAEAARKEYEKTKDAARNIASNSTNAANNAFKDAGNAFKKFGKKKKHKKKGPDPKFAASVFDWDYYYDAYPDLVKAKVDLAQHWKDHGLAEGRRGSLEFHTGYYRKRYTDVQAACAKTDRQCVLQHWIDRGVEEGRQGSPDFSVLTYQSRYDDVPRNLTPGDTPDAMEHWLTVGSDEGRDGSPSSTFAGPIAGPTRVGSDSGGGEWSDDCTTSEVRGFRIFGGRVVDRVQFKYASGTKVKMSKPGKKAGVTETSGWSSPRGSGNNWGAEVILADNEYIVQVDYRSGSLVDRLTFKSNTGKTYGPYGGGGGSPGTYKVTPGEKLGCMSGRAGKYIDQLILTSTGPR